MPSRFRALILLGAFTSLRWGELVNVTHGDVDLATGSVLVARTLTERDDGTLDGAGTPKLDAGRRRVAIPALLLPDLTAHFAEFVEDDPAATPATSSPPKRARPRAS